MDFTCLDGCSHQQVKDQLFDLFDRCELNHACLVGKIEDLRELKDAEKKVSAKVAAAASLLDLEKRIQKAREAGAQKAKKSERKKFKTRGGMRYKTVTVEETTTNTELNGEQRAEEATPQEIELANEKKTILEMFGDETASLPELMQCAADCHSRIDSSEQNIRQFLNEINELCHESKSVLENSNETSLTKQQIIVAIDSFFQSIEQQWENYQNAGATECCEGEDKPVIAAIKKNLGAHRRKQKLLPFVPSCRKPFVIDMSWAPERRENAGSGGSCQSLVVGWGLMTEDLADPVEYQLDFLHHTPRKKKLDWQRIYTGPETQFRMELLPGGTTLRVRAVTAKGLGPWSPELFVMVEDIDEQRRLEEEQQKLKRSNASRRLEFLLFHCCQRIEGFLKKKDKKKPLTVTSAMEELSSLDSLLRERDVFDHCSDEIKKRTMDARNALHAWMASRETSRELKRTVKSLALKVFAEPSLPEKPEAETLEQWLTKGSSIWSSMGAESVNAVYQTLISVLFQKLEGFVLTEATRPCAERWLNIVDSLCEGAQRDAEPSMADPSGKRVDADFNDELCGDHHPNHEGSSGRDGRLSEFLWSSELNDQMSFKEGKPIALAPLGTSSVEVRAYQKTSGRSEGWPRLTSVQARQLARFGNLLRNMMTEGVGAQPPLENAMTGHHNGSARLDPSQNDEIVALPGQVSSLRFPVNPKSPDMRYCDDTGAEASQHDCFHECDATPSETDFLSASSREM